MIAKWTMCVKRAFLIKEIRVINGIGQEGIWLWLIAWLIVYITLFVLHCSLIFVLQLLHHLWCVLNWKAGLQQNYVTSKHCGFGDTVNAMVRDRLVCGISDRRIQTCLLLESSLDFSQRLCTRHESWMPLICRALNSQIKRVPPHDH